jgi:hypothetical protein
MRCYGFPEKCAWVYSTKEPDAIRHRPTRQWYRRYLHRCARQQAKKQLQERENEA